MPYILVIQSFGYNAIYLHGDSAYRTMNSGGVVIAFGKTISWYFDVANISEKATYQLNATGREYFYVAIG